MKNITALMLFVMLIYSGIVRATHIVGGEFELKHVSGNNYTLSLKMYFDEVNGNPEILTSPQDQSLTATIFSKTTNQQIASVFLSKFSTSKVNYTDPLCSRSELKTLILLYRGSVTLDPSIYNEAGGYYIVWERCCRNGVINNILAPGATGQAFYLEFPAVTFEGNSFINSSPSLFPPLSDYGCVNKPFYYDFSGTDVDGDSLVYSMVTPFAGSSSVIDVIPLPRPAPYNEVAWESGYDKDNMIRGNPSMRIDSKTGQLFVIPNRVGLFVFGVRCEEYRNGRKLGEVRRDFQMMVLDCPVNDPPKITVGPPPNKEFKGKRDTVNFDLGEERCFKFSVKDPQVNTNLTVNLRAVNFDKMFVSPTQYTKTLFSTNDSLTFSLCFPDCPLPDNKPYMVEVIAKDNGCSLPLLDTVILVVNIVPPPNALAELTTDLHTEIVTVKAGSALNFNSIATDADGDSLYITATPIDFEFAKVGMQFEKKSGTGNVVAPFSWTPVCDFLNLNIKDEYEVEFKMVEVDKCKIKHTKTIRIKIKVEDDPNQPVILSINKSIVNNTIIAHPGQQISFDVYAEDPDRKYINLQGKGINFNFEDVGISFQNMEGTYNVTSPFNWPITCDYVSDTTYEVRFIAYDKSCFGDDGDTINVSINIKDIEQDQREFIPPNVFTPNGDSKNDLFTLENLPSDSDLPYTRSLPKDLCGNIFEEVIIVNRWGNVIYKNKNRDFAWDAKGFPAGSYFYTLKFSRKVFKGTIAVIY
jgi:hypothetical protein